MGELALEPVHLVQHVFFPQMGIHIENLHPNLLLSERPETRARCSARRNSKPVSFDQTAADGWRWHLAASGQRMLARRVEHPDIREESQIVGRRGRSSFANVASKSYSRL